MKDKALLNKMVSSALNKDGVSFTDAFNDAAMLKIQTAIENQTKDVAQNIINTPETSDSLNIDNQKG